jgi:hypothetical protein
MMIHVSAQVTSMDILLQQRKVLTDECRTALSANIRSTSQSMRRDERCIIIVRQSYNTFVIVQKICLACYIDIASTLLNNKYAYRYNNF